MRRGLMDLLAGLFRTGGGTRSGRRPPPAPAPRRRSRANDDAPARDIETDAVTFEYSPCLDGDPDPGEVVWTWVPYEEDPTQGKDRPVVIIGRRGPNLIGVPLTSKQHDNEAQVHVGTGSWDREGRPSYAKLERVLEIDPEQVRREGAVLSRAYFDDVVAGIRREQSR